jgi:serine/threonine protein kinase
MAYVCVFVQLIAFQVFHGLADMHAMRFMHRDVKPHNILIDFRESAWEDCHARGLPVPSKPRIPRVVLADLGLARSFADVDAAEARQKTNEVVTLWYRAPEVVLGSVAYGPAIDVWSLGCVLGELARCIPDGCPPLQSTSPTVRPSRNETYERLRLWTGSEDYGQLIRVFAYVRLLLCVGEGGVSRGSQTCQPCIGTVDACTDSAGRPPRSPGPEQWRCRRFRGTTRGPSSRSAR